MNVNTARCGCGRIFEVGLSTRDWRCYECEAREVQRLREEAIAKAGPPGFLRRGSGQMGPDEHAERLRLGGSPDWTALRETGQKAVQELNIGKVRVNATITEPRKGQISAVVQDQLTDFLKQTLVAVAVELRKRGEPAIAGISPIKLVMDMDTQSLRDLVGTGLGELACRGHEQPAAKPPESANIRRGNGQRMRVPVGATQEDVENEHERMLAWSRSLELAVALESLKLDQPTQPSPGQITRDDVVKVDVTDDDVHTASFESMRAAVIALGALDYREDWHICTAYFAYSRICEHPRRLGVGMEGQRKDLLKRMRERHKCMERGVPWTDPGPRP